MVPKVKQNKQKFMRRLLVIGLVLVLLIEAILVVGWQRYRGRYLLTQSVVTQAKLLSACTKPNLIFRDAENVLATLNLLQNNDSIIFCGVYDAKGNLFTAYYRSDVKPENLKVSGPPEIGSNIGDGCLKVSEKIIANDEVVGTIWLWSKL